MILYHTGFEIIKKPDTLTADVIMGPIANDTAKKLAGFGGIQ